MTSTYGDDGDGGAGGKLRRQPHRKHNSTPYARPLTQLSNSQLNPTDPPTPAGWLSKIVDPARRLISTGATRFLPSVFSNSSFSASATAVSSPDPDEIFDGDANNDDHDQDQETDLDSSRLPEVAEHIRSDDPSNIVAMKENMDSILEESGLSEIEQLMRGKLFSRNEANRLREILLLKAAKNSHDHEEMINLSKSRQSGPYIVHSENEIPRPFSDKNRENSSYATWEHVTTTPVCRPTLLEEVGASPVDIARAYMGSISTGVVTPFSGTKLTDRKNGLSSVPTPQLSSSKHSIYWPGARVQEHRGFLTPQNPRRKYGLCSSQRSPYSRTIDSKSNFKLTPSVDRPMSLHVSERSYRQTVTPAPTQDMDMADALVDDYGSVGPIRSKRRIKVQDTPFKGCTLEVSSSAQKPTSDSGTLLVFKSGDPGSSSISQFQQTLNNTGKHAPGIQSPHPHSSQMARRILDHIDRKVPTLQEKTEEIKIACSRQKASLAKLTTPLSEKDNSALLNSQTSQSSGPASQTLLSCFDIASNSTQPQGRDLQPSDSQKFNTLQWNSSADNEGGKDYTKSVCKQVNGQSSSTTSVSDAGSAMPAAMTGQQSRSFGNKPPLTSITVNKPNPRSAVSFGNSSVFTFPVPASSESEPPTPSITPAKVSHQHEEGLSTPLFTFGSRKTSPNLVFSFPTTSSLTNQVDEPDIKFQFGSDTVNRISFSAVAKNTIDAN